MSGFFNMHWLVLCFIISAPAWVYNSLQALAITGFVGADTKSRTRDLLITSQLLYQLSYVGFTKTRWLG